MLPTSKCFHKQTLSKNALSRLNSIQQFEVSEIYTPQKRSRNQKKTQKSREKLLISQIAENENNETNKQTNFVFLKENN